MNIALSLNQPCRVSLRQRIRQHLWSKRFKASPEHHSERKVPFRISPTQCTCLYKVVWKVFLLIFMLFFADVGNHHHFYPYVQSIPTDNQSSCSGDIFSTRLGSLPLKAKSEPMNTLEMTLQYPQAHQVNQPAAYHEHLSPESLRSCNYSYV